MPLDSLTGWSLPWVDRLGHLRAKAFGTCSPSLGGFTEDPNPLACYTDTCIYYIRMHLVILHTARDMHISP